MCQLTDQELLEELQNGNQQSFKIIYDKYFKTLYRYTIALTNDGLVAEDLIQELFIGLWEHREHQQIQNLNAYLKRAIKNKIINLYKRNKYVDLDDNVICMVSPDRAEDTVEENYLENEYKLILNKLPKRCRDVFYLSRIKMYKNNEIAEELNISIRTVESHMNTALHFFKKNLINKYRTN